MKVLQVMAGAEFGGAEAFFTRLVLALHRAGLDQRVIIRANERRAAALRAGGLDPVEVPFGGPFDLASKRAIKREIKAFGPQAVLSWMNRASAAVPVGDHVNVGRLGGYYDLKYYRTCDHLIGNTEDIVEYLVREGWPEEKAHYLPNFVSGEPAPPVSRRDLYTPDRTPLILAMGRLHENKAFDVLLEAVSRVPNVYLWIAGEGPLRQELEKMSETLAIKPRVRFLGWREDIPALLATCDLFVCPSRHEPLGNVVIEAWAHGAPTVATDAYGPGTLVEHMESGVLVPVDDAATLGRAIRNVLEDDDLRERIATRGHETYQARFTEEAVTAQYLEFLQKVVT